VCDDVEGYERNDYFGAKDHISVDGFTELQLDPVLPFPIEWGHYSFANSEAVHPSGMGVSTRTSKRR
jgi:hypothetical protein